MPTRPDVEKWNTGKLSEWATQIDTAIGTYETQLGRMLTQFTGTNWVGGARDAAYDRFSEENTEGRKLSQEIRDATAALRGADGRLADERRILLGKVADAEADTESPLALIVNDRWAVQTKQAILSGSQIQDDLRKTKERIDHHQGLINTAYYSLAGAISEVATAITNAAEKIRGRGDLLGQGIDASVTPSDTAKFGHDDGKAVHDAVRPDGTVDKAKLEEIAGHLPEGVLTEQDLEDLANGKDVATLPASTQAYYREFYQGAGKDGILAMNDYLKGQEDSGNPVAAARRDALANGLMVVSNERIGTGRNPDGSLQSPGSYKQLPDDLRKLVSTRVGGPDANATTYPTCPPDSELAGQHRFLDETKRFGDLIKQTNPGFEPGTEFSRELTRQAAALGTPGMTNDTVNMPGKPIERSSMEGVMRDYLEVSSRNHEATTQLLTGQTEPGSVPLDQGYDPKKVIQPLLQYDWDDSNGKQPPQLFNWIGEQATPHPATDGHPEVTADQSHMAGRAASGLAALLTADTDGKDGKIGPFEALMNMPGHDRQSIGQINPGLTRQLTGAMIPYLDNIAGAPGDPTSGFALRDSTSENRDLQAVRLSALFNTDPVSSGAWNAAITQRTNDYAAQYAAASGLHSNDRGLYTEAAGRLLAYQEQGLRAEAYDRHLNDTDAAAESAGRKKLGVDIAASILSDGVGEKAPFAGTAIDVAGKVIADGIKPEDTYIPKEQQEIVRNDLRSQMFYSMLQAKAQQDPNLFQHVPNQADQFPSEWLENGRLKSYEEIVGQPGTERNFQAQNHFSSAADAWLDGLGVDTDKFRIATVDQRFDNDAFTKSEEMYKSRVLKGQ
ncbi:hypothetical protein C5E45_17780 [Nocardia nova]|uniref:TPR repeat domain-containing protein n=1 Tax=Nocardia nova TaxID=37330 RepID=A0A2S6APB2_9NOCA|nr:hypothetical protein [Nocardia nova]PPJ28822.1 hypothetical protein C5E41_12185 [Nocardia nova]PPJ37060.1 hypothetical protein C5E45_17780 [Nocardia nova]